CRVIHEVILHSSIILLYTIRARRKTSLGIRDSCRLGSLMWPRLGILGRELLKVMANEDVPAGDGLAFLEVDDAFRDLTAAETLFQFPGESADDNEGSSAKEIGISDRIRPPEIVLIVSLALCGTDVVDRRMSLAVEA